MVRSVRVHALFVIAAAVPVMATTLTFPNNICSASSTGGGVYTACSSGGFINQAYGDGSAVDVQYVDNINPGASLKWWGTGYNTLPSAVWGGVNDSNGQSSDSIFIRPLGGNTVTLVGFDAGAFSMTTRGTHIVIRDAVTSAVLSSSTGDVGNGSVGPTHFTFDVSSPNGIEINWYDTGYNVGLNNIEFTVGTTANPEPATILLAAAGLLAVRLLKRR